MQEDEPRWREHALCPASIAQQPPHRVMAPPLSPLRDHHLFTKQERHAALEDSASPITHTIDHHQMKRVRTLSRRVREALMQEDEPRHHLPLLAPFPQNHHDPLTPHPPFPPDNNRPFADELRPSTARERAASHVEQPFIDDPQTSRAREGSVPHMEHDRLRGSSPPRQPSVVRPCPVPTISNRQVRQKDRRSKEKVCLYCFSCALSFLSCVQRSRSMLLAARRVELSLLTRLDVGAMNATCSFCGALDWIAELASKTPLSSPLFSACCQKGSVDLPFVPDPPAFLETSSG
jgi:hypothetical protein